MIPALARVVVSHVLDSKGRIAVPLRKSQWQPRFQYTRVSRALDFLLPQG